MKAVIFCNGGTKQGIASIAASIFPRRFTNEELTTITIIEILAKEKTSNEAEYIAITKALKAALNQGIRVVKLKSSSLLVINQIKRQDRCKALNLQTYRKNVWRLLKSFDYYEIEWLPIEKNRELQESRQFAVEQALKQRNKP